MSSWLFSRDRGGRHNDYFIVRKILWLFLNDSIQGKSSRFFLHKPIRNCEFQSNRLQQIMIYESRRFFFWHKKRKDKHHLSVSGLFTGKKNDVKEKSNKISTPGFQLVVSRSVKKHSPQCATCTKGNLNGKFSNTIRYSRFKRPFIIFSKFSGSQPLRLMLCLKHLNHFICASFTIAWNQYRTVYWSTRYYVCRIWCYLFACLIPFHVMRIYSVPQCCVVG